MRNKNISFEGKSNLNNLIKLLKIRLASKSKQQSIDKEGNITYVDMDIYTEETLNSFIELSISEFNMTPSFSSFSLENSRFIDCFTEILVEGAMLYALSSQALLERGREFQLTDNGINFEPPKISDMLTTQYQTLLTHHWEKLKYIKSQINNFQGQDD